MQWIKQFFTSPQYTKRRNTLLLLLLVVAIPLTVFIAQQQQELRQRAQQEPTTPPSPSVTLSLSSPTVSLTPNETYPTSLSINSGSNRITGVDITLTFDPTLLSITGFTPTPLFNNELIKTVDNTNGALRYSAVDTVGNTPSGTAVLGIITFKAGTNEGTSATNFQNIQITTLGQVEPISNINAIPSTFTIAMPTPTPIPTTTPTPAPTTTPTPTPLPLEGDVNGDGSIDILDFNIWRNEFIGISTTKQSDLNKDGKIDLVDFSIWRNAFNPQTSITPTPTTGISVDKTAVTATLSRAIVGSDGLIKGPGFTLTSYGATSWSLFNSTFASGQGFSPTGGGIVPGSSLVVNTFVNSNKPNGIYTGSYVLEYIQNGVTVTGPTISYSITLTD